MSFYIHTQCYFNANSPLSTALINFMTFANFYQCTLGKGFTNTNQELQPWINIPKVELFPAFPTLNFVTFFFANLMRVKCYVVGLIFNFKVIINVSIFLFLFFNWTVFISFCMNFLIHGLANYGPWTKYCQLPVFRNKVLLEHSQVHLFTYRPWLLLSYNGRVE